jgi:hypothetical protein
VALDPALRDAALERARDIRRSYDTTPVAGRPAGLVAGAAPAATAAGASLVATPFATIGPDISGGARSQQADSRLADPLPAAGAP